MRDMPFDQATDVTSIAIRLHPLDVGFDLRGERMTAEIACEAGSDLRAPTYDELYGDEWDHPGTTPVS